MYRTLSKIFYVWQVAFSVIIILFGTGYCLRCLFSGQLFGAVCFAFVAYVAGYRLLFRASVKELRESNESQTETEP